jgi:hypothetical protein
MAATIARRVRKNKTQNCKIAGCFCKKLQKISVKRRNASESPSVYQMKDRLILRLLVPWCLLVLIVVWLAACSRPANHSVVTDVDYWTCGMHPSVRSKVPGKCPICGMELVPVASGKTDASVHPNGNQQGAGSTAAHQSAGGKELSPFAGVVSEAPVKIGMGVKPGDKLLTVLNLSQLWLWASFYENEFGLLREGQTVTIDLPAFPNRSFAGKIGAISPTIDPLKRIATVRIDIPNADGQLRPGMYANLSAEIDVGEGLTIPFDAVLPTGSRMLVFVDKGSGKLQPRFVQVGRQFADIAGPNRNATIKSPAGCKRGSVSSPALIF